MRIVHTSDWHAGRLWKGIPRLDELRAVLDHLAGFLERERVDLLLVSGDVFDSGAPRADAERAVFDFFKRVGRGGTQTVVIAGNHDSPDRLAAWGTLAELVDVHVVDRPRRAEKGGVVEIAARSGVRAVVAAVPFARPGQLVSALELAESETLARQEYAEGMRRIVEHLSASFRADTVNLLMLHTHLEGAVLASGERSERAVHLGDEWAATPQALPADCHYIALGHIHKPQRVDAAPSPAFYAGSPLQLDFGEAGEEKSFVLVDAEAGRPARIERVPYEGGRPLADLRLTLDEIERDADRHRDSGWLRVRVPLEAPDPDVNRKVRKLLPNAVSVQVELPEREEEERDAARPSAGAAPRELYVAYYRTEHGREPEEALLERFEALRAEAQGERAEEGAASRAEEARCDPGA